MRELMIQRRMAAEELISATDIVRDLSLGNFVADADLTRFSWAATSYDALTKAYRQVVA